MCTEKEELFFHALNYFVREISHRTGQRTDSSRSIRWVSDVEKITSSGSTVTLEIPNYPLALSLSFTFSSPVTTDKNIQDDRTLLAPRITGVRRHRNRTMIPLTTDLRFHNASVLILIVDCWESLLRSRQTNWDTVFHSHSFDHLSIDRHTSVVSFHPRSERLIFRVHRVDLERIPLRNSTFLGGRSMCHDRASDYSTIHHDRSRACSRRSSRVGHFFLSMTWVCSLMIAMDNDEKAFEFLDLMAGRLVLGDNEFHLLDEIGSGTYAKVYKAIDCQHQREVAIKCMLLDSERYGLLCVVIREINLLLDLKHPNIVHLYDIVRRENEIYLILEYMNTDLYQYLLRHHRPLADLQVKVYFYQLLNGLAFCHRNKGSSSSNSIDCSLFSLSLLVFHRDLK